MGRMKDLSLDAPDTSMDDLECCWAEWQKIAKQDPAFEKWLDNMEADARERRKILGKDSQARPE
jgi:hypothetical protein